jgi:hypothetical protein
MEIEVLKLIPKLVLVTAIPDKLVLRIAEFLDFVHRLEF